VPKGDETRPTSSKLRETVFNMLQNEIEEALFLDLFAGSGAMGIEAISRGAKRSAFVDASLEGVKTIKDNVEALGLTEKCKIYKGDYLKILERLSKEGEAFDILFSDAPYPLKDSAHKLLDFLSRHTLLKREGRLLIETEAKELIAPTGFTLSSVRKSGKTFPIKQVNAGRR
jgi:16S rRNA (guanine966-N2)-methyltransferase